MSESENEELESLRAFARLMVAQLPEPFAVDMLLMLYQLCMARAYPLDETLDIFGPAGFTFVTSAVYAAPRENPEPRYKIETAWPQDFVVTQIGHIDADGVIRPAHTESEGGAAFLFQEFFRRRRSGN